MTHLSADSSLRRRGCTEGSPCVWPQVYPAGISRPRLLPWLRFHDLRHAFGSLLAAQGVHPRVAMELMGHSQLSVTMQVYTHVVPELAREAAGKIDRALTGS